MSNRVAIRTKPNQIIQHIVRWLSVFMVHLENSWIFFISTPFAFLFSTRRNKNTSHPRMSIPCLTRAFSRAIFGKILLGKRHGKVLFANSAYFINGKIFHLPSIATTSRTEISCFYNFTFPSFKFRLAQFTYHLKSDPVRFYSSITAHPPFRRATNRAESCGFRTKPLLESCFAPLAFNNGTMPIMFFSGVRQ